MSPAGKRTVFIVGVVVMVGIVVAAVVTITGGSPGPTKSAAAEISSSPTPASVSAPDPMTAAREYLTSFAVGDTDDAALLTDDPTASSPALRDAWQTLKPSHVVASLGKVGPVTGNTAPVTYAAKWTLDADHVWSYAGTFDVVRTKNSWQVHWTPAVLQPTLRAGEHLALVTTAADQTAAVDRDGKPLVITGVSGPRLAGTANFPALRSALVGQVAALPAVFAVERVDTAGRSLQTLYGTTDGQVRTLKSTLSTAMQSAAQSVVDGYTAGPAVIVALRPADGGLLAVAQNSQSTSSPFSGLFAPGSTFKIATATAAIENGIATPGSSLDCPLTERINTRTISNEGFALGETTMTEAFARSCNTTFGRLAFRLPANGLVDAADQYGLNADFAIPGLNTQTGKVVPATDSDQRVEDGIGQGAVLVSPFGEALMAATVAEGHAVTPRLWQNKGTSVLTGYTAPSATVLGELRPMMRAVVTSGTATGLAHSGVVYGKTGTAQTGADTAVDAHGWFVGYRGDLAFAVFLENSNDSRPAVTLAARFLATVS
jgi:beta-lactamase class D